MSIAVVGAGAMGSLFAAHLALSGEAVTLVDTNAERRARIARDGIVLDEGGDLERVDLCCVAPETLSEGQQLVILLTKFGALRAAFAGVMQSLSADGAVLVLANGLGVGQELDGLVRPGQLMLGVTDVAADLAGAIVHRGKGGTVRIGWAVDETADENVNWRRDSMAAVLRGAGFTVSVHERIMTEVWHKLSFNAAFNALATLVDRPVSGLDHPAGRRIMACVLDEAAAVALEQGHPFDRKLIEARIDAAFLEQGDHLPSMLQDRRAGRRTEIEAINGAIAREAMSFGLSAPVNATLADLVALTEPDQSSFRQATT